MRKVRQLIVEYVAAVCGVPIKIRESFLRPEFSSDPMIECCSSTSDDLCEYARERLDGSHRIVEV